MALGHAAAQRVVGVHEQQTGVRIGVRIGAEGRQLVREGHDPAVRVRPRHGHVEHLARKDVGRGAAAGDQRGARAVEARVRALGAAQAELHDQVALRGLADARRLGGDERLVVDDVEHRRLDELGLEDRGLDAQQGFVGEDHRALGHGVDLAREAEVLQVVEELLVKQVQRAQIGDVLRVKVQVFDVVDHLLRAPRRRQRPHFRGFLR